MHQTSSRHDCLGLRYRIISLSQTFKWLHQTPALHTYLTSLSAADTDVRAATTRSMCGKC